MAGLGFCVVLSFIFMYTLRCFAGLLVWLSSFGIILVFGLAGIVFFYNAGIITTTDSTSGWLSIPNHLRRNRN